MEAVKLFFYTIFRSRNRAQQGGVLLLIFVATISTAFSQNRHCGFVDNANVQYKPVARQLNDEQKLYIPVIFHIVYNGEGQNIPNEQIYAQLKVLNEDFNLLNSNRSDTHTDFTTVAASANVEFFLADEPSVQSITRTATTHGPFYNDDLHITSAGGQDGYETDKYLNVWVADLEPGLFGYGAGPGTPAFRDGVAIDYEYFGINENAGHPYNLGRTLTHETGHWLGLQHPWGSGGCDSDDGLTDTPLQKDPTAGCSTEQISCGSRDMVQNFMNTSEDACMTLFTSQQAALMRQVLLNDRASVIRTNKTVTAIAEGNSAQAVIAYPNPISDVQDLHIQFFNTKMSATEISLTDINGQLVREKNFSGSGEVTIVIDMQGLTNGMYLAKIGNATSVEMIKIYLNRMQ